MISVRGWIGVVCVGMIEAAIVVKLGYYEWSLLGQWAVSFLMVLSVCMMFQPDAREVFREVVLRQPPRPMP